MLVSGWAHVLHAMYKPWGAGSNMYLLQHGSLFVTTFVFLMGLLFKVRDAPIMLFVRALLRGEANRHTVVPPLSRSSLPLCGRDRGR